MTHISYADLQQNLSRYLYEAAKAQAPILVTRQNAGGNVVIMAESKYAGLQETVHLLSSTKNAERLLRGRREAQTNGLQNRDTQA